MKNQKKDIKMRRRAWAWMLVFFLLSTTLADQVAYAAGVISENTIGKIVGGEADGQEEAPLDSGQGNGGAETEEHGTAEPGTDTGGEDVSGNEVSDDGAPGGIPAGTENESQELVIVTAFKNYNVKGFAPYVSLTVPYGCPWEELGLPETVIGYSRVNGAEEEEISIPVSWKCIDDSFGGTEYVPGHENNAAVYTMEAVLPDGYTLGEELQGVLADRGWVLPWAEVKYESGEGKANKAAGLTPDSSYKMSENGVRLFYSVNGTNTSNKSFNIKGSLLDNTPESEKYITTYNDKGYGVYLKVDGNLYKPIDSGTSVQNALRIENGAVWNGDGTAEGIQIQPRIAFMDAEESYIKVTYAVCNTADTNKTIGLGIWGDIKIAANDNAPINKNSTGVTMSDNTTKAQFNFYGMKTYGVTTVDNLWIGDYRKTNEHVFASPVSSCPTSVTGIDSGMSWSWDNRLLKPGEIQEFTVYMSVGETVAPPEVDIDTGVTIEIDSTVDKQINVAAKVTEKSGIRYNLYYALDSGEAKIMDAGIADASKDQNPIEGNGTQQEVNGKITVPADWDVGSIHKLEVWVKNEKNAMSDVKTVYIKMVDGSGSGKPEVAKEYTVSFSDGGGSGSAPVLPEGNTYYEMSHFILPQNTYTRTGYTYKGWSDGITSAVYLPGTSYTMPSQNVTLTAVWQADEYPITYSLDGGSLPEGTANPDTYTMESTEITLANPEKPGYMFLGWSGTGITGDYQTEVKIPQGSSGSRNYTAHWGAVTLTLKSDAADNKVADTYGSSLNVRLYAEGGSGNYTYEKIQGELPAGITLNANTGAITGPPGEIVDGRTVIFRATDTVHKATADLTLTFTIGKRLLHITGIDTPNKVYDGKTAMTPGAVSIRDQDILSGDDVKVTADSGAFADPSVGTDKDITLQLQLSGQKAGYYEIASPVTKGSITPRPIAVKPLDIEKKTGETIPAGSLEEVPGPGTGSALAEGDTLSGLGNFRYTYTKEDGSEADKDSPVTEPGKEYRITAVPDGPSNANYQITLQAGKMSVTQDTPVLNANYIKTGTPGADSWYKTAVVYSPTGGYYDSLVINGGIPITEYRVQDKEETFTLQLRNTSTGAYTSRISLTCKSDTKAPVFGEVTYTVEDGNVDTDGRILRFLKGIFYKKEIIVEIPCLEDGSGIDRISYQLPGKKAAPAKPADGKITFTIPMKTDGEILLNASDLAGNKTSSQKLVKDEAELWIIENAIPVISEFSLDAAANEAGWYKEEVTVSASVTDNSAMDPNSGLYKVTWQINKGKPEVLLEAPQVKTLQYDFRETITDNGEITLRVNAEDVATNQAEEKTITLKIDTEAPVFTVTKAPEEDKQNAKTEFTFTLTDAASGVDKDSIRITGDDGSEVPEKELEYTVEEKKNGVFEVNATAYKGRIYSIHAKDFAGNELPETRLEVSVAKFVTEGSWAPGETPYAAIENQEELLKSLDLSGYKNGEDIVLCLLVKTVEEKPVPPETVNGMRSLAAEGAGLYFLSLDLVLRVTGTDGTVTETELQQTVVPVKLRILIPEKIRGMVSYELLREHAGKCESIPSSLVENGTILEAESDRFSTYAIAYKPASSHTGGGDTGSSPDKEEAGSWLTAFFTGKADLPKENAAGPEVALSPGHGTGTVNAMGAGTGDASRMRLFQIMFAAALAMGFPTVCEIIVSKSDQNRRRKRRKRKVMQRVKSI